MVCYTLTPLDTLFFRGNIPMEAGQIQSVPFFPPPVSVISGAVRTQVLRERNVTVADYKNGKATDMEVLIGKFGIDETPFSVTGILIQKDGKYYVPAPALWYVDTDDKLKMIKNDTGKFVFNAIGKSIIGAKFYDDKFAKLGIESSEGHIAFIVPKSAKEAQPMKSCWVSLDFLQSDKTVIEDGDILLQSDIFLMESRTGIGIDENRTVEKGKLYTAQHIRLRENVEIAVLFDKDCGLGEKGTIQLGGEMRICAYKKGETPEFEHNSAKFYVSIAPIEAKADIVQKLAASQKFVTTAGWNLANGFHKPTKNWIPSGAVFNTKVNTACIALGNK